jgi:putative phosphoribosyl transferase
MWRRTGTKRFADRRDAGSQLADVLAQRGYEHPVIVALPRGGVPVGAEVAARLGAPLDVLIVRKLGCPGRPELGVGAIAEGGVQVRNDDLIAQLGLTAGELSRVVAAESAEMRRRAQRFRGDRPRLPVRGRTAIVVDDGLATGSTARAAIDALRRQDPARIVLAVPVAPVDTAEDLTGLADEVVCLRTPDRFLAIGQWYTDFDQVPDAVVSALLSRYGTSGTALHDPDDPVDQDVHIPAGGTRLQGILTVPVDAVAVVVFAHGSGSSRTSPRNRAVAHTLQEAGLATLLFDLLDDREADDRRNVFDVRLLAERLLDATRWLEAQPAVAGLPIGYFGASTGAAAALAAAARRPDVIAVVSRGGRPDLADAWLSRVRAPTLLIVGGRDTPVIELNRRARVLLGGHSRLEVVPGATHLFGEPGALERVAALARDWFIAHVPSTDQDRLRTGAGRPGGR